jgi:signal peptidase
MEPAYPVGSILVTKKIDADELVVGDVISFYSKDPSIYGKPNTHRIESKGLDGENRLYFITKGDNNPIEDRFWVYEDSIIGKVSGSIPVVGKVMNKINNRVVLFFLLIVPLFVVLFFEMGHIKKLIKGKEKEQDQPVVPAVKIPDDTPAGSEQELLDKINKIQAEIDRLNATASNAGNKE